MATLTPSSKPIQIARASRAGVYKRSAQVVSGSQVGPLNKRLLVNPMAKMEEAPNMYALALQTASVLKAGSQSSPRSPRSTLTNPGAKNALRRALDRQIPHQESAATQQPSAVVARTIPPHLASLKELVDTLSGRAPAGGKPLLSYRESEIQCAPDLRSGGDSKLFSFLNLDNHRQLLINLLSNFQVTDLIPFMRAACGNDSLKGLVKEKISQNDFALEIVGYLEAHSMNDLVNLLRVIRAKLPPRAEIMPEVKRLYQAALENSDQLTVLTYANGVITEPEIIEALETFSEGNLKWILSNQMGISLCESSVFELQDKIIAEVRKSPQQAEALLKVLEEYKQLDAAAVIRKLRAATSSVAFQANPKEALTALFVDLSSDNPDIVNSAQNILKTDCRVTVDIQGASKEVARTRIVNAVLGLEDTPQSLFFTCLGISTSFSPELATARETCSSPKRNALIKLLAQLDGTSLMLLAEDERLTIFPIRPARFPSPEQFADKLIAKGDIDDFLQRFLRDINPDASAEVAAARALWAAAPSSTTPTAVLPAPVPPTVSKTTPPVTTASAPIPPVIPTRPAPATSAPTPPKPPATTTSEPAARPESPAARSASATGSRPSIRLGEHEFAKTDLTPLLRETFTTVAMLKDFLTRYGLMSGPFVSSLSDSTGLISRLLGASPSPTADKIDAVSSSILASPRNEEIIRGLITKGQGTTARAWQAKLRAAPTPPASSGSTTALVKSGPVTISEDRVFTEISGIREIFGNRASVIQIAKIAKATELLSELQSGSASMTAFKFADLCRMFGIEDDIICAAATLHPEHRKLGELATGRGFVWTKGLPGTKLTPGPSLKIEGDPWTVFVIVELPNTIKDSDKIENIARRAGLNLGEINFTGSTLEVWQNVFASAQMTQGNDLSLKRILFQEPEVRDNPSLADTKAELGL